MDTKRNHLINLLDVILRIYACFQFISSCFVIRKEKTKKKIKNWSTKIQTKTQDTKKIK